MTTEEERERFHNGDTLPDGIPAIRVSPPAGLRPVLPQEPKPPQPTPWVRISGLALAAGSIGALAAVGAIALTSGKAQPEARAEKPVSSSHPPSKATPRPTKLQEKKAEANTGSPSPSVWSAPTEPETTSIPPTPNGLVTVNVISSPATGGDPGMTFCLRWTGSGSGEERDAVLLMQAPAYQCSATLVSPTTGQVAQTDVMTEEPVLACLGPKDYPAVLENAWDSSPPLYTCLSENHGA